MSSIYQPNQEQETDLLEQVDIEKKIIIHNDDINTFEWVIETLVEVCKHNKPQAEQCAYIIHYKGKYAVKHGSYNTLKPMKDQITDRGIDATIE
ncbi:MAG: ATP-dependent Clp protease adaptor ClpS [Bacteroidetes bacterium]|nr:ATP-dependent Clp protease adaptor ClpS [Bacteroidota bacterium]